MILPPQSLFWPRLEMYSNCIPPYQFWKSNGMIHFSILPTDPEELSPVLTNSSIQTTVRQVWGQRRLSSWNASFCMSHFTSPEGGKWQTTYTAQGWHAALSIYCMLFLMGSSWHFSIHFDLIPWVSNLSIRERWQSDRQVLTNCKWQVSRMLQDMLNSHGIQFHCFNLEHSMRTSSQKGFLPPFEKCFWSLKMPWPRATASWSGENGQSYN